MRTKQQVGRKKPQRSRSLVKIYFLYQLLGSLLLAGVLGYIWVSSEVREYEHEAARQRQQGLEWRKAQLRERVDSLSRLIEQRRAQAEDRVRGTLVRRTQEAYSLAAALYDNLGGMLDEEALRGTLCGALRSLRDEPSQGYHFVLSADGNLEMMEPQASIEGQSLLTLAGGEFREDARHWLDQVVKRGETFLHYRWSAEGGAPSPELGYAKYFKPLDWIIGIGEYESYVESMLQEEILDHAESIQFDGDGYVFAGTYEGLSLSGPGAGGQMWDLQDKDGVYVVRRLAEVAQSGGGFFSYEMPPLEPELRKGRKISYVVPVPGWDWYVGAGAYVHDIDAAVAATQAEMRRRVLIKALGIAAVLLLAGVVQFLLARRFRRGLQHNFTQFDESLAAAAQGRTEMDEGGYGFAEFQRLAASTNAILRERNEADAERSASEARYRTLFHDSAAIMLVLDPESGEIHQANSAAAQFYGFERQTLEGTPVAALTEDGMAPLQRHIEAMRSGDPAPCVCRQRNARGEFRHMEAFCGEINLPQGPMLYTILHDITDRVRAEHTLHRLYKAIEEASEYLVILDDSRHIEYVNPAFERLTGYGADTVIGQPAACLHYATSDDPGFVKAWRRLEAGESWSGLLMSVREDGAPIELEASLSPIREEDDSISGYVVLQRDISRERHLERQMRQAQKMEAIGTLAGGIAHDFNNILSAVIGFADLARTDAEGLPHISRSLDEVLQAGRRAQELVSQILAFSRQKEQEKRPIRLQLVVKEAARLLQGSIPKTIRLQLDLDPACGPVLADPTSMHQIVMNLCTNAYHAMREYAEQPEQSQRECVLQLKLRQIVPAQEEGITRPMAELQVADTGTGMAPELVERIFDPYFTTKERGEGTGLGLATVQGIVESHQGVISVSSTQGEGSVFTICLPICATGMVRQEPDEDLPYLGAEHVLLVDDEETVLNVVGMALERLGYKVTSARNGLEGLNLFERRPAAFDVVVSDLSMPGMSGLEFSKHLLALRPELPVILCTGFSERSAEMEAMRIGVRDVVYKPIVAKQLATRIRTSLLAAQPAT